MEIREIKLSSKQGLTVVYETEDEMQDESVPVTITKSSVALPTLACQNALQALKVHLIALEELAPRFEADYVSSNAILTDEKFKSFKVTGIKLSGYGEDEKVIIIGKKNKLSGNSSPIKTDKQALWNDNTYEYSGNLQVGVDNVVELAERYIGGECQPTPKNVEIPFPKEEVSDKAEDLSLVEDEGL